MTIVDWLDPFLYLTIPIDLWVEQALDWLVSNFRYIFQAIKKPFHAVLTGTENGLKSIPPLIFLIVMLDLMQSFLILTVNYLLLRA